MAGDRVRFNLNSQKAKINNFVARFQFSPPLSPSLPSPSFVLEMKMEDQVTGSQEAAYLINVRLIRLFMAMERAETTRPRGRPFAGLYFSPSQEHFYLGDIFYNIFFSLYLSGVYTVGRGRGVFTRAGGKGYKCHRKVIPSKDAAEGAGSDTQTKEQKRRESERVKSEIP